MIQEPSGPTPVRPAAQRRTPSASAPRAGDGAADAGTAGKRYYRIGEVSRITGVKAHVLRYWESEFRWMAPAKSRSQQRLYRRRDIDVILLLKRLLHEERFTIAGARKRLRDLGIARALEEPPAPHLDLSLEIDHTSRYRKIREELAAIRDQLLD